ncbi:MAG: serine/threonine-protein kinase [Verrucomicrobia bacterium]|nr:serine/threonine-protein kinase [Verrucomicrobiota bacterium]
MTNLEGQTFAGYEILSKLGQGGMGAVYKARQPMLDRLVALKVISPSVAGNPDFIARFRREATAAAQLNHPNIVQLYSAGESEGVHFMACEFIDGESLQGKLDRRGRLDPRETLAVCVFVCEALKYAWATAKLIHRDIKPDNIFLSKEGDVKVGDFGLAKRLGSDASGLTKTGTTMESPHYMSPEQALGHKDLDFRCDTYSVGCTLYHMLAGAVPYNSKNVVEVMTQHCYGPLPAIAQAVPGCPAVLVLLVNRMLAKNRDERHASHDDLIAHLLEVREQIRAPQNSIACAPAVGPARLTPHVVKPGSPP